MSQAAPWGRGAGEGIGLSGHKNEYKAGVRIGNWVEEQFGAEAPDSSAALKVAAPHHEALQYLW